MADQPEDPYTDAIPLARRDPSPEIVAELNALLDNEPELRMRGHWPLDSLQPPENEAVVLEEHIAWCRRVGLKVTPDMEERLRQIKGR